MARSVRLSSVPAVRSGAFVGFDTRRWQAVVYGGLSTGVTYRSDLWVRESPSRTWRQITYSGTGPGARATGQAAGALIYEPDQDVYLVLCGYKGGFRNDVQSFDPTTDTWSSVTVTGTAPTAKAEAVIVYDRRRKNVLVYGGYAGGAGIAETHTLTMTSKTAGTWASFASTGPGGRYSAAGAWDDSLGEVLMFGGAFPVMNDLWSWDGAVWTARSYASPPSARRDMAMAPVAFGKTAVHGGRTAYNEYGTSYTVADLYVVDTVAGTWTNKNPSGAPSQRNAAQLWYDDLLTRLCLFGGAKDFIAWYSDEYDYELSTNAWSAIGRGVSPARGIPTARGAPAARGVPT